MAKYRKLPVIVEAERVDKLLYGFRHDFKSLPEWVIEAYDNHTITSITDVDFYIKTLEGEVIATHDDYLVKGIDGELYPCKIKIFEKTYERVGE